MYYFKKKNFTPRYNKSRRNFILEILIIHLAYFAVTMFESSLFNMEFFHNEIRSNIKITLEIFNSAKKTRTKKR